MVAVDLFDRALIGNRLVNLVEERTGRRVEMAEFDLRWRWPIELQAGNLSLSNAPWGREQAMLQVGQASLFFHPLRWITGRPPVSLALQEPQLLLERSAGGETNWAFAQHPLTPARELPGRIEATDGQITLIDPRLTQEAVMLVDQLAADITDQLIKTRFSLDAAGGQLDFDAELALIDSMWETRIQAEVRGIQLSRILAGLDSSFDPAQGSYGVIGGQGTMRMRGTSAALLIESMEGQLTLLMSDGALDERLVQVASMDIIDAVLAPFEVSGRVPINCAYARLVANEAVLDVERFVVDTADTTFQLAGNANLESGVLALVLHSEAKQAVSLGADARVEISGSFSNPKVEVDSGSVPMQVLGALALGAVATPAAALLPFVQLGSETGAPQCQTWVEQLQAL